MKRHILKKLCAMMTGFCLSATVLTNLLEELNLNASAYDADAAIAYAHQYALNYNPDYHNYNPDGGDCANFVSQCLYAGGLEMTDGWHYKNGYSDVTDSWVGCRYMRSYFEGAGYTIIDNPSLDELIPGNPVLYWNGERWSHAAIYVGDGKVCAHNNDRYDVNWTLNYAKTCTILISNDRPLPDEPIAPYPRPNVNVKKGMKGSNVGWVQYTLDFLGYDIGSYGIDCDFGSATESAVKAFQSDNGLEADGIVGTKTRNKIVEKVLEKIEPHGEEMTSGYGQCLPDGDYFIFSQLDPNYYVDVSGAAAPADAGTNVAMWHLSDGTLPSAGDAHDAWTLHYVGNGFYTIAQKGTGMYLDVFNADKKRGTNVQLWTGHGGTAQLWSIRPTDTGYKIQAKCSSYCLDVCGAGTDNGTNVQVWESNDSGSQRFAFVPFAPSVGQTLADGIYMIQLKADPAFCLDVQGYENKSYTSETNVQLWKTADCNDAFQVTYLGDGYYSICEVISGLTLDVIGVGGGKYLNTGNNIQVYKNNLTRNQKWIIRKASSGGYQIISAYSGYSLDLSGGVTELRGRISQYYCNTTNAQIWEFGEALAKPEKSVLSADKASAFAGETVTFTADSDTATGYTIGIDKDGERLITQAMPDGKLSLSFADAGEYSAYVTAFNAMGYCDSERITFTVKPYELTLYETEKHTIVMQDVGTTYKTSNADVAVVSKNGVITAMGKGAAVITVTDGSAKQVQIIVQVFKAPVTGDCTADGVFDSDDVTALCEWLTTESAQNMNRWENADLNEDGLLTAVDLTLMKQLLLK